MPFLVEILEKRKKPTTYRRLRVQKSFQTSYEHAKVIVGKLMTCATLCKLILSSYETLNARKRHFFEKLYFSNSSKIAIFHSKMLENCFQRVRKRKNRHQLTSGGIEID